MLQRDKNDVITLEAHVNLIKVWIQSYCGPLTAIQYTPLYFNPSTLHHCQRLTAMCKFNIHCVITNVTT